MSFDINQFRSNINRYGVLRPSNFELTINKKTPEITVENNIRMRCMAVNLPGRDVMTVDNKIYGPQRTFGYDMMPGRVGITIICSENMSEKEYFEQWVDDVVGNFRTADANDTNRFEIGYYDDYAGTANIKLYSDTGEIRHEVELQEAWPVSIGEAQLSWAGGNEVMLLNISMVYRFYRRIMPDATAAE